MALVGARDLDELTPDLVALPISTESWTAPSR